MTMESFKQLTAIQRKSLLQKRGLNVSGTKNQQIKRLEKSDDNRPYHSLEDFQLQTTIDRKKRPQGIKNKLRDNIRQMEYVFGLRSRITKLDDLKPLSNSQLRPNLTECLFFPYELQVSKEICLWCSKRNTCDIKEQNRFSRNLSIQIGSKYHTNKEYKKDSEVLKNWFEEKKYVAKSEIEGMLFTNISDPFRPGYGLQEDRKLTIIPLTEVTSFQMKQGHNWSHMFFSEYMGRTLTVFEASVLNSLPNDDKFKLNKKSSFQKINGLRNLFAKCEISGPISTEEFAKKIQNSTFFSNSLSDSLSTEDVFFHGLLEKTEYLFNSGLYDSNVELFYNFDLSLTFNQHLTQYYYEVYNVLQGIPSQYDEKYFIASREYAQICYSDKVESLKLPLHYQILRLNLIKNLSHSWIIIDSSDYPLLNHHANKPTLPAEWLQKSTIVPSSLKIHLRNSVQGVRLQHWDSTVAEETNIDFGRRVNYFSPSEIFTAHSMNLLLINYLSSTGDAKQLKMFEKLENIMQLIFFKYIHGNEYDNKPLVHKFLKEFMKPEYRKETPLQCLRTLGRDQDFQTFINYIEDPDGTDYETNKITWEIQFKSPKVSDSIIEDQVGWYFRHVSLNNEFQDDEISESGHIWKLYHETSSNITFQKQILNQLIDILNWSPEEVLQPLSSFGNLWISPGILDILNKEGIYANNLRELIRKKLNQEGTQGVLMVALEPELSIVEQFFGSAKTRLESISDEIQVHTWLPETPVGPHSRNFLHIGKVG
jgi:hypothetical protein